MESIIKKKTLHPSTSQLIRSYKCHGKSAKQIRRTNDNSRINANYEVSLYADDPLLFVKTKKRKKKVKTQNSFNVAKCQSGFSV